MEDTASQLITLKFSSPNPGARPMHNSRPQGRSKGGPEPPNKLLIQLQVYSIAQIPPIMHQNQRKALGIARKEMKSQPLVASIRTPRVHHHENHSLQFSQ